MQTEHLSREWTKASTPSRKHIFVAMIGAALIGYLVHKTPDARGRLEKLASLAQRQGELTASDALVIAQVLARPTVSN
ncbi:MULTISPECIES: hypothetical protein [Pseudomonas]|uniref:hypothetical protein n=1 Tax=Pseudomonas TaxID=286 RepID=UPI000F03BFB4|nr:MULTISPECIES: hypothetical protein [Pseudomonas]MCD5982729.1 hypothetical protein [Pseudomonas sp. CDFA 610]